MQKPLPDYELCFYRCPEDFSIYNLKQAVQDGKNPVITYEDVMLRWSILYRALRRRLMNSGYERGHELVETLFKRESDAIIDSYTWTDPPAVADSYDDWEGYIYSHTQLLLDGYSNSGFSSVITRMRFPSATAYNNLAHEELLRGEYLNALKILKEALKLDFECQYAWYTMSEVYRAMGKMDKSEWALGMYHELKRSCQ